MELKLPTTAGEIKDFLKACEKQRAEIDEGVKKGQPDVTYVLLIGVRESRNLLDEIDAIIKAGAPFPPHLDYQKLEQKVAEADEILNDFPDGIDKLNELLGKFVFAIDQYKHIWAKAQDTKNLEKTLERLKYLSQTLDEMKAVLKEIADLSADIRKIMEAGIAILKDALSKT